MKSKIFLNFASLCCVATVHSYVVGVDCKPEIAEKINEAAKAAFERIDLAANQLFKVANNAPDMNPHVKELAEYLFDEADFKGVAQNLTNLHAVSHSGIDATNDVPTSALVGFNDAIIYCTDQRFGNHVDKEGKTSFIDKTWYILAEGDSLYPKCFKTDEVEMYTSVLPPQFKAPSVIQICPKFLKESLNPTPPKECKGWHKLTSKMADKLTSASKTEADGVEGFTQTLLHEFTHTKAGGQTIDVGVKGVIGFIGETFFNKDSYGWKNSVRLHTARNADSVALFCMHVWQITSCGLKPNRDGKVASISG